MSYAFESIDGIIIGGCSSYSSNIYYWHRYGVGSIVYFKPKALRGVFEKIVIKEVRMTKKYKGTKYNAVIYVDTLNAIFTESELIKYDDAVYYVKSYREYVRNLAEKTALNCK